MKIKLLIYCLVFFSLGLTAHDDGDKNEVFVDFMNKDIEYMGRIAKDNVPAAELYWSGTSIKINFEGTFHINPFFLFPFRQPTNVIFVSLNYARPFELS